MSVKRICRATVIINCLSLIVVSASTALDTYPYRTLSAQAHSLTKPIPSLEEWEINMKSYGAFLCETLKEAHRRARSGSDAILYRGNYYDAQRVYYQIADYTNQPNMWNSCALVARQYYRDQFLPRKKLAPQGHDIFPHGLLIDYLRTGDVVSKQYAVELSYKAAFASSTTPPALAIDPQNSRPVAYNIMSFLVSEELGEPRRERLSELVNNSLSHIDQWFVSRTAVYVRPFMVGLTAEALIQYYEKTKDPRVPPAIETTLAALWRRTWRPSHGAFMYTDRDTATIDNTGGTDPAPVLNLLIAPAYAWLYKHKRDPKFRDQADQIFAGSVSRAKSFLSKTDGKFFNQNYRWSFDYVRWRVEGDLGPVTKPD